MNHTVRRRTHMPVALLAVLALLLAACGDGGTGQDSPTGGATVDDATQTETEAAEDAEPVTFGYMGDQTGPNNAIEVRFQRGVEAAIALANSEGNREIELLTEDTKFDVDTGLRAYERLTSNEDVLALIGVNASSIMAAITDMVEEDQIPVLGPAGTTPESLANPYFYNHQLDLETQAGMLAEYLVGEEGEGVTAGNYVINVASGEAWTNFLSSALEEQGAQLVEDQYVDPGAVEARAQVSALADADPDVLSYHGNVPLASVLVSEMQAAGLDKPVYSNYSAIAEPVCEAIEGVTWYGISGFRPPYADVEGADDVQAAVQELGLPEDEWNNIYFIWGWTIGRVATQALSQVDGEVTRESFRDALESGEFDTGGFTVPLSWEGGARLGNTGAWIFRCTEDGRLEEVAGPLSATSE